jgi:hypothetical protein
MGDGRCREGTWYAELRAEMERTPIRAPTVVEAEEFDDIERSGLSSTQVLGDDTVSQVLDTLARIENDQFLNRTYASERLTRLERAIEKAATLAAVVLFVAILVIFW